MATNTIQDFNKVLPKDILNGNEIVDLKISRLTAAGDNYGSTMLLVDVDLKNVKTGKVNTLNTVAKTVPTNEFIVQMFQPEITFNKEIELYNTIIPTLQQFQKDHGIKDVIDFVPKFYGGRLGLEEGKYDQNAVLLLENLKIEGYVTENRNVGFDFSTTKLILQKLAQFHAIPLALKLKKPKEFELKIKPYLKEVIMVPSEASENAFDPLTLIIETIEQDPFCSKYYPKLKPLVEKFVGMKKHQVTTKDFLATVVHCDLWVNNVMIKPVDGKVEGVKLVDFQMTHYDSPGRDVSFFLFTSVQNDVIVNKYDELVAEYHKSFINTLKQFDINTEPYSLKVIHEDIKEAVQRETLIQCLVMLNPIFAHGEQIQDIDDFSIDRLIAHKEKSPEFMAKLRLQLTEFEKRGWI